MASDYAIGRMEELRIKILDDSYQSGNFEILVSKISGDGSNIWFWVYNECSMVFDFRVYFDTEFQLSTE